MTDQQTPVPTFQTRRIAGVVEVPLPSGGQVSLDVDLDVDTGTAVVTLPGLQARTEIQVITTDGDLVRACIEAAIRATEDAEAGRVVPLVGKSEFQAEEVVKIAFECGGAATAPLMQDHPTYVFPSERVKEAVDRCLLSHGLRAYGDGTVDRVVPE